jgi:hypothetical protein
VLFQLPTSNSKPHLLLVPQATSSRGVLQSPVGAVSSGGRLPQRVIVLACCGPRCWLLAVLVHCGVEANQGCGTACAAVVKCCQ